MTVPAASFLHWLQLAYMRLRLCQELTLHEKVLGLSYKPSRQIRSLNNRGNDPQMGFISSNSAFISKSGLATFSCGSVRKSIGENSLICQPAGVLAIIDTHGDWDNV